jgi:hypothetical protein
MSFCHRAASQSLEWNFRIAQGLLNSLHREPDPMAIPRPHGPAKLRGYIEGLGPYQSLALLAVPTSLVEPLKLLALAVAGEGHWVTGTIMIIAAHATSLLLVERLFSIIKPKLLMLPWFARLWRWVVTVCGKVFELFAGHDAGERRGLVEVGRLGAMDAYEALQTVQRLAPNRARKRGWDIGRGARRNPTTCPERHCSCHAEGTR